MSSRKVSAPSAAQQRLSAERAAAARARIAAAQRHRQLWQVGAAVLAVIAVVVTFVVIRLVTGGSSPKSGEKAGTAQSSVVGSLASIPTSAFDAVGRGTASNPPTAVSAPPLSSGGMPRVLYVGAEYCPYCAAERWAMVVALSRFGTFHGLGTTASSPSDVYPNTQTLSFHGATFTSRYLAFAGVETQSNQVVNGRYAPLDTLSAADEAVLRRYDAPPYVSSAGGIPFVDFAGKYVLSGATYGPGLLQGKTRAQIVAAVADPGSPIAKGILGAANVLTAAICTATGQQPAAVCTSAGVQAAAATLK